MKLLENKVILVTGAGRGFGKYMCLAYANEGAIVIAASRTIAELSRLKKSIEEKGGKCITLTTDLLNMEDIIKLRDSKEQYSEEEYFSKLEKLSYEMAILYDQFE